MAQITAVWSLPNEILEYGDGMIYGACKVSQLSVASPSCTAQVVAKRSLKSKLLKLELVW